MMNRFGINVTYSLSGLYDLPVSVLPGEEPLNKGSEFSQLGDHVAAAPPDVIAGLRRSSPGDIAWRVLSPAENYTDDTFGDVRYAVCQASAELREALWEAVADAGTGALDLPRRLADAWDNTRKQREYLNARDDGHAAIYYAHAYKY
jgi:hypothetical protein